MHNYHLFIIQIIDEPNEPMKRLYLKKNYNHDRVVEIFASALHFTISAPLRTNFFKESLISNAQLDYIRQYNS